MQLLMFSKVKKPTPWLIGIVAAGLLGTATTVTLAVRSAAPKADITDMTLVVASKDLVVQIKANGVVQVVRKINLSPKEAGRIAQLYVDEGGWFRGVRGQGSFCQGNPRAFVVGLIQRHRGTRRASALGTNMNFSLHLLGWAVLPDLLRVRFFSLP